MKPMVSDQAAGCVMSLVMTVFGGAFWGFVGGWQLMLAAGALHHDVDSRVPAIGYWPAVAIMFGWLALTRTMERWSNVYRKERTLERNS